jgi:hypothetical protein
MYVPNARWGSPVALECSCLATGKERRSQCTDNTSIRLLVSYQTLHTCHANGSCPPCLDALLLQTAMQVRFKRPWADHLGSAFEWCSQSPARLRAEHGTHEDLIGLYATVLHTAGMRSETALHVAAGSLLTPSSPSIAYLHITCSTIIESTGNCYTRCVSRCLCRVSHHTCIYDHASRKCKASHHVWLLRYRTAPTSAKLSFVQLAKQFCLMLGNPVTANSDFASFLKCQRQVSNTESIASVSKRREAGRAHASQLRVYS